MAGHTPGVAENSDLPEDLLAEVHPRLVWCRRYVQGPDWCLRHKVIARPVLWWFERGSADVLVDRERYRLAEGDIFFLRPGAQLSGVPGPDGPPVNMSINFHAWVLGGLELTSVAKIPPKPALRDPERVRDDVRRLFASVVAHDPTLPLVALACLADILGALLAARPGWEDAIPRNPHILRCVRRIHQDVDRPPAVGALAHSVGLSTSHMRNLFRDTLGVSPQRYMQSVRFARACSLLADPAAQVGDVARRCGFEDANYFARWFRRHAGTPPSVYRQRLVL